MTAVTHFVDVDVLDITLVGVEAGGGLITVVTDQVPAGQCWRIDRIVWVCTSNVATKFKLYKGAVAPLNQREGFDTAAGALGLSNGGSPLRVDSGLFLTGQWVGAQVGSSGVLALEGMVSQRVQIGAHQLY